MLTEYYPEVNVIKGDGNLWWTGGVNVGIEAALSQGADYCLTLNDDTILPEEYLANMVAWAKQKPEAVIGSLEKDASTKQVIYGGEYCDERTVTYLLETLPPDEQAGIHPVTTLPGRGLWIPRVVFEKIGFFDRKRFPHYLADYDFTYNAFRAGFEMYINYDAFLYTFPEACGANENMVTKTLKGYYNHLFSIRGGANLRDFTRYTLKNCPPKHMPRRFIEGYARRLLGYWVS